MRIQRASLSALDAARQQAVVVLHPLVDAVVDRLGLAVGVAGADHEEVRVADDAAQVDHDDVDRLLVGGELGDARRAASGVIGRQLMPPPPSRYRPRSAIARRDRVGHELADRPALGDAAAHVEEEMSMRGMAKKRDALGDAAAGRRARRARRAAMARALGDRRAWRARAPPRARASWAGCEPCRRRR